MPADISFSKMVDFSPCLRIFFRKSKFTMPVNSFSKMGGGSFKKCAFFAFSKVEIHNAFLKMGEFFTESRNSPCLRTLVFRKVEVHLACGFFAFSKVEIHNACKH